MVVDDVIKELFEGAHIGKRRLPSQDFPKDDGECIHV